MSLLDSTCMSAPCAGTLLSQHQPIIIICCIISSWEFLATLDYEWSVIRRRRPYPWTFWVRSNLRSLQLVWGWALSGGLICLSCQVYFTTRVATLLAVVFALLGINLTARYNCEVRAFHMLHMRPRPDRP